MQGGSGDLTFPVTAIPESSLPAVTERLLGYMIQIVNGSGQIQLLQGREYLTRFGDGSEKNRLSWPECFTTIRLTSATHHVSRTFSAERPLTFRRGGAADGRT